LYPSDDETLASLVAKCREKTWPHLKNSTRQHYEFFMDKYLLPTWGTMKLRKMSIIELQDFFNSFHPRLSPKSIRLMHACLRVHLNQAKVWGMVEKSPAIGVKLPRKKQRKPTILLPLATISKLIELLPEPTKTVVMLIVFGSLRIGEVLALRWRHIQADRINIEERVYEGEFDDVKTDAGEREVPFDKRGLMKSALIGRWNAGKHRQPDDLVFSTRKGGPLGRRADSPCVIHTKGSSRQSETAGAYALAGNPPGAGLLSRRHCIPIGTIFPALPGERLQICTCSHGTSHGSPATRKET
jgi:integrase